ncbi:MAG: hypothetical protein Q9187_000948 [Circinaria calcarea]
MPSFLSDLCSEPVTLTASETSIYEPPHQSSHEKPASRSASTTETGIWHFTNGNIVEPPTTNKHVNGILADGNNIANNSLQSLPNGRSSESTHGPDRPNSRNESSYSTVSGLAGSLENGRKSPGPVNGVLRHGGVEQSQDLARTNRGGSPLQRLRTPDSIATAIADRSTRSRPHALSEPQSRRNRSASASNPQSPFVSPNTSLELSSSEIATQLSNRYSTPPIKPTSSLAPSSSSTILPHPGVTRLQHRHTLQVPKATTTRVSREFSWPVENASEDAITATLSPTAGAGRRGSLSLVRRTTRSIHSDMYLEEIPQDGEAARWTETIRQKRASRKKKKEEDEDDRVVVGTKVDMNHVNWVTAYNMLTGIRFTVSRTNAKMDRELTEQDFDVRHKFSFDITGNELTPSAKYDFKFKDYAPWVFRHLRTKFGLDPADYLISLTSKYILSELGSPGKSGSFFYFSRDYKYIIKTIHHAEHKLLRRILRDYYAHIEQNPNTLISQFYGLHRVKIPYGRKIHFVVMNNLFPPHRDIHQTFDLKGSTIGRNFREDDLEKNPRATLKDLNWLRRNYHLEFGPEKKRLFIDQVIRDVRLLQKLKIMDYSLLVGIHDLRKGNEENLRDKTLQVFQPGVQANEEPQPNMLTRTPSKLENARKARELRNIIKREKPVPMEQSSNKMPEEIQEERRNLLFYSDDGGFRATHEDGRPGDEIYYLGIIDCLTHYGIVKKAEHLWKGMSHDKSQISPIAPQAYGDRFVKFITGITMPSEQVEQQSHDQLDGSIHTNRPSSHYLSRSSTDRVMEKAEKQALKTADQSGSDGEPHDRTMGAIQRPSTDILNGMGGPTLPIVQEDGEASSTGGRSAQSRERENGASSPRPQTPNGLLLEPPPLGGNPPPTPPKDIVMREKQLPSLPQASSLTNSFPILSPNSG